MTLLAITQCTNLGGMEHALLELLRRLQHDGTTCSTISLNKPGPGATLYHQSSIQVTSVGCTGKGGWRSAPRIAGLLRRQSPDLLLMTGHHVLTMVLVSALIRRSRRVLWVHHHHAGTKPSWMWWLIYEYAVRCFDRVAFASEFIRNEAMGLCPRLGPKSILLRNAFESVGAVSTEERLDARKRLGLPPDRPVVGNAGWLIGRKRFDIFLETAARVKASRPDALFAIAGDGPEASKLRALAASK